jgi:hypothetical protein
MKILAVQQAAVSRAPGSSAWLRRSVSVRWVRSRHLLPSPLPLLARFLPTCGLVLRGSPPDARPACRLA